MRASLVYLSCLALFALAAPATADDDGRTILDKAITAHGGKDKLNQTKIEVLTIRGSIAVPRLGMLPFTGETYAQLPNQFKNVVRAEFQGNAILMVTVLDGAEARITVNGEAQPVDPRVLEEMKEARFAENALTLTPLLGDTAFKLTVLKEQEIKGRPAVGILVQAAGHKDYRMFFDKERGVLVKTERLALNDKMQEVRQESYWLSYQLTGGINRARRFCVYQDGRLHCQGEITEVRNPDRLPPDTFTTNR